MAPEISRRVASILDAVEHEAARLREDARVEAARYSENARRRADDLVVERQRRISELSDELVARSEAVVARLGDAAPFVPASRTWFVLSPTPPSGSPTRCRAGRPEVRPRSTPIPRHRPIPRPRPVPADGGPSARLPPRPNLDCLRPCPVREAGHPSRGRNRMADREGAGSQPPGSPGERFSAAAEVPAFDLGAALDALDRATRNFARPTRCRRRCRDRPRRRAGLRDRRRRAGSGVPRCQDAGGRARGPRVPGASEAARRQPRQHDGRSRRAGDRGDAPRGRGRHQKPLAAGGGRRRAPCRRGATDRRADGLRAAAADRRAERRDRGGAPGR